VNQADIMAVTSQEVIWAQVDLDAIAHNVRQLRKHIGDNVELMAVVKDNAYGHGALQVAPVVIKSGADRLAVARMVEGIQLRRGGVVAPILVLGYLPTAAAPAMAEHNLTPAVTTLELGQAISAAVDRLGRKPLPVHVKVDSGMGRFGVLPDEVLDLLRALSQLPGIRLEGIFTHFSTAESADQSYSRRQLAVFSDVLKSVRQAGFDIPLVHAANSPATIYLPAAHLNLVRPGLPIYGWQPSAEMGGSSRPDQRSATATPTSPVSQLVWPSSR
jgi:alanine racemase